jgi:hypothetical protein
MVRQRKLGVVVERLEGALDQAEDIGLEHLHFLLSMALMEARQQLSAVKLPLRLVVCDTDQA